MIRSRCAGSTQIIRRMWSGCSRELFDSKEWSLLDEGTLTDAQALERVQKRLPNEHLRWLAKESLEHWHEYNIWAKPGMGELVKELKEKGCGIYLCSNCSVRLRVFEYEIPALNILMARLSQRRRSWRSRIRRSMRDCLKNFISKRKNAFSSMTVRITSIARRAAAWMDTVLRTGMWRGCGRTWRRWKYYRKAVQGADKKIIFLKKHRESHKLMKRK